MSTEDRPALNLPVAARRMGGAVVEVLSWTQHLTLPPEVTRMIGMIVTEYPQLNTVARIDYLADLAGYHGQPLNLDLVQLLGVHPVERVYLAIDTLYECGYRSCGEESWSYLEGLVVCLEGLAELGYEPESVIEVAAMMERLGGFAVAFTYGPGEMQEILEGAESAEAEAEETDEESS